MVRVRVKVQVRAWIRTYIGYALGLWANDQISQRKP